MKRAVFCYLLVFICLIAGSGAFGQSDAREGKNNRKTCPFSIVGLWRMERTTEMTQLFFDFSPEGHITLLGHSPGTLPQDFEMIGTVNYKLDKPRAPKQIEFITTRGNDAFQPGITLFDITEYSDNGFTTKEPASGQQTRWVREQAQRYFLTFAARSGPLPHGGSAFAMLSLLDGRQTKVEALGVQLTKGEADKTVPVFGPIPAELYDQVKEENEKDKKDKKVEILILRFELSQPEYDQTKKVFETWLKLVNDKSLPNADPYLNALEFLRKTAEALVPCGEKVKLYRLNKSERDEIVAKHISSQHPQEYIRAMKKMNQELHVSDATFPWQWRPVIQTPGQ